MITAKKMFIWTTVLIITSFFPFYAYAASNSVENSERLAQISRATGTSSGNTTTFENRMDAILSNSRSQERAYVVNEETTARERAAVQLQEEQEEIARAKELNPGLYNPKKSKDNIQVTDSNAAKASKYDGTEKAYQTTRENIQKEFDERIKKESALAQEKRTAERAAGSLSTLPPSLANNPFYVGEEEDPDQKRFESRKAVIVSRLVERGIAEEDASASVGQATSEEDLIVNLMKNYDLSYGDATDAAS